MLAKLGRHLADVVPAFRPALKSAAASGARLHGTLAETWPQIVQARTEKITIALTAYCNLRCTGCRYGRDFMPGAILPADLVEGVIEDAAAAGIPSIRLYGGEPLLHPDLPRFVARATELGVDAYVTTNGLVLDRKIDALRSAGLRKVTIGYYGHAAEYDAYVQRPGRYSRLLESLEAVRAHHKPGDLALQFNFLLSRRSASVEAFEHLRTLAERFDAAIQIDLVHYSLPYFTEGPERELQFRAEDGDRIARLTEHLVRVKAQSPAVLTESSASLASIPDWALRGAQMRVPCDAGKLLWIGADGSVKLCYVTFDLGNLHRQRLRDILYTAPHHSAARAAFRLECPNCHCERGARIEKHAPSHRTYTGRARAIVDAR